MLNELLDGIGRVAAGAFAATPAGQGMLSMERHQQRADQNQQIANQNRQRTEQGSIRTDLAMLKSIESAEGKKKYFDEVMIPKHPELAKMQNLSETIFQQQTKLQDPIARINSYSTAIKNLTEAGTETDEAGDTVINPDMKKAIGVVKGTMLGELGIDPNEAIADSKSQEIATARNTAMELLTGELDKKPQDTKRIKKDGTATMWDDTISPENVKTATDRAISLLTDKGYSEEESKNLVSNALSVLSENDTGIFKKYPKMESQNKKPVEQNTQPGTEQNPNTSAYFSEDQTQQDANAPQQNIEPTPEKAKSGILKSLSSFFQASTPTVPEANEPKTFEQSGVKSPQQQQTLQEMQDALPDVDFKQEYADDPNNMERLIKLWQQKKIDKTKLKDFFSKMQQQARSSLGIA